MKTFKLRRNVKGFTLIEVMVGVCIIGVVVLAILATLAQSVKYAEQADMVYTASLIAQGRIDLLRKFNFSDISYIAPESGVRVDEEGSVNEDGEYSRTTVVTKPYDSNENLLKVKVSVDRYRDGNLIGHPVVFETLFSDIEN